MKGFILADCKNNFLCKKHSGGDYISNKDIHNVRFYLYRKRAERELEDYIRRGHYTKGDVTTEQYKALNVINVDLDFKLIK